MHVNLHTEKMKKIKVDVFSSMVDFIEYSQNNNILLVKFKKGKYKGKIRSYDSVTPSQFFQILESDSVGRSVLKFAEKRRMLTY